MRQFFYMVSHDIVGDDFRADKIFLQEHEAISWGRKLATKNPEYSVYLYKQEIARTSELKYVKQLPPYNNGSDWDIDQKRDFTHIEDSNLYVEK